MANTGSDDETEVAVDDTDQGSRELGVEFGELEKKLDSHEYPTTAAELVEAYGEHELELPSGEESFEEALGPYTHETDQEFGDADEVRQAVLNMVGGEAVGEKGYTDRGLDQDSDETQSF